MEKCKNYPRWYTFIFAAELFLPNKWPTYFKKAKGCFIWDWNGKIY